MSHELVAQACAWKTRCEPIRAVLQKLRDCGIEGVCAGGALRDLWFDKEPKDVDVFVGGYEHALKLYPFIPRLEEVGLSVRFARRTYGLSDGFLTFTCIWDVVDTTGECPWVIQLIFCSEPAPIELVLARIDFGLCRIGMTLDADVITPEFIADAANKQFTIHSTHGVIRSVFRFRRLLPKYPDFALNAAGYDARGNNLGGAFFEV